jgi:hypothetical protein
MQLKMKGHLTNELFMLATQFTFAPGPLQQNDSPSSDVSMRELIQVEVLRSCCELWLDKQ